MVLTSPRREKQRNALAMVAVSSGGCSGLNDVVPVILLASRKKEKAHELQGHMAKLQHLSPHLKTFWNGLATMKLPRRRSVAGGEEDNELRCSGAKEKGRMGSGDARGGNKYGSTVNLDMDQRLWRIWIWTRRCPSVLRWQNGVSERKRGGHVALHFASSCFTLPWTRPRAWTR